MRSSATVVVLAKVPRAASASTCVDGRQQQLLARGGQHVLPRARVVARGKPCRRVTHRLGERTGRVAPRRAHARSRSLMKPPRRPRSAASTAAGRSTARRRVDQRRRRRSTRTRAGRRMPATQRVDEIAHRPVPRGTAGVERAGDVALAEVDQPRREVACVDELQRALARRGHDGARRPIAQQPRDARSARPSSRSGRCRRAGRR